MRVAYNLREQDEEISQSIRDINEVLYVTNDLHELQQLSNKKRELELELSRVRLQILKEEG
jgi:hypothetical protein